MENKKSQAWGIDLMVAMIIFMIAVTVFFIYALNQSGEARSIMEDLLYDGNFFSNTLLSEGYPDNWVEEDVVKIGILNNEKINDTKLEKFYDIVQSDYNRTKLLFGIKYDYYFFLEENMTIGLNEIEGIGKPGIIKTEIVNDSENLIKVTRFVIYKGKPVPAYIYILEDVN